ncbi:hypothetical protein XENOCAPTIV_002310, partial [Xenoophorus captivus]
EECTDPTATGSAAACKKQRTAHTLNETRQAAELNRGLMAHSRPIPPDFLPHALRWPLLSKKHICSCPAAAVAQTDLCCPSAQCAAETTKPVHDDDDAGNSRNQSMAKCPVIALVNHVKGNQRDTQHREEISDSRVCQAAVIQHANTFTHFLKGKLKDV